MKEESDGLYEACVGFMVAEKSHTNSWECIAKWVHALRISCIGLKEMKEQFAITEELIKADFGVTKLPSAYRSAKATALAAVKHNLPLMTEREGAIPKTEVANAIAASKAASKYPTESVTDRDITAALNRLHLCVAARVPISTSLIKKLNNGIKVIQLLIREKV